MKPAAIVLNSPNQDSRDGVDIDAIIVHHTASFDIDGDLAWLMDPNSEVSSHYIIDKDGTLYQLVPDERRAWHAGRAALHGVSQPSVNHRSLGVELVHIGDDDVLFTEAQYRTLCELVPYLARTYQVPEENIVGHKDVALPKGRKPDPAKSFDWERLRDSVRHGLA